MRTRATTAEARPQGTSTSKMAGWIIDGTSAISAIEVARSGAAELFEFNGHYGSGTEPVEHQNVGLPRASLGVNVHQLVSTSEIREDLGSTERTPYRPAPISGLQKWTGRVLEVEGTEFSAELIPLDHKGPSVVADFDNDQLDTNDDEPRVGDVFYVTVRTVIGMGGLRSRTSSLRLRRLGKWSEEEVRDIEADVDADLAEYLKYVE